MIVYPLTIDGLQTRILEAGEGDRHLFFIHGLGARADRWAKTIERFAQAGYHCIALDLPGHGFADKGPARAYSVPAFAEYCSQVLKSLGVERVALVGTSLGGHIAATLSLRREQVVLGLSMVGAVGIAPVGDAARAAIRDNIGKTTLEAIRGKLEFVLADPRMISDAWVLEEWRINTSRGAAEAFAELGQYFFERINGDAVAGPLFELSKRVPMQLIWGALDRAVPVSVGEEASALLGGLRLELIPGAGHAPYFEQPTAFDAVLSPFLAALPWS